MWRMNVIVLMMRFMNLKLSLQKDLEVEEVNTKVNYLSFSFWNKVGHIATRCPDREDKDEKKEWKYKGRSDDKDYRRNKDEKGKKYCYITKEKTNNESESNDDEVVYVAMNEESYKDEKLH